MIAPTDFPHTTPLHEPGNVIAAIDSDNGLSFVLREVTVRLLDAKRTLIEPEVGFAQIRIAARLIYATVWVDDMSVLGREMPPLQVTGRDAQGDNYNFQMTVESRAAGENFASLSGRVLILKASHKLKHPPPRPYVVLRIRKGLAYPFSSGVQRTRTWGEKIIEQRAAFEGYYGETPDGGITLDVKENLGSATLTATFQHNEQAEPERLMDAVDGAASYALGTALDPLYASAVRDEVRTVVLLNRSAAESENQLAAPVDLRLHADEILKVFVAFFRHALSAETPSRANVHALVQDLLQTFRSTYIPHQILVTCIAIEALLRSEAAAAEAHVFSDGERETLRNAINTSALDDAKKDRVHGLLSQVNRPSVSHLFDQIIATKLLNVDHKKAWQRNRSTFAHGGSRDDDPVSVLSDRVILLNCFHRLLLSAIGIPVPAAPSPIP